MNKAEFQSLPPDLQRDVRLAVAIGWPLDAIGEDDRGVFVRQSMCDLLRMYEILRWNPTADRTIWAGLLEAFPIAVVPQIDNYEVWFAEQYADSTQHPHIPAAIVCEVIRRDPLGHLSRSGL